MHEALANKENRTDVNVRTDARSRAQGEPLRTPSPGAKRGSPGKGSWGVRKDPPKGGSPQK